MRRSRRHESDNIVWPVFVDGLAGLLVAVLFLLIFFVAAQTLITQQLQNKDSLVARLRTEIVGLETQRVSDENTIVELDFRLQQLNETLQKNEEERRAQAASLLNLGKRLNAALAEKASDLTRYRSEFFGRLRNVLGKRTDIRIVGDRFVIQSEVLFASGSADIGAQGQAELEKLAATIIEIAEDVPDDIAWVIRIDGHTDSRPIRTELFPSNWELSTARALAVARFMISQGVPADRLAPTGFAGYHPIAAGNTPEEWRRNRRIEFKFTQR